MKLVMIGNGMAGARTLEELLKIGPDVYDITVFGAEPHANYNRILLSPVLAGEMTIQDIMLNDVGWYEKNGIRLHLGKKVVKIERGARKVVAADGTAESYDRLLLATGSNPFILPVPGKDLEGVLTYRDIQDTNAMIEASKRYKHAVVIGGGLLGLEAANGLKRRGMEVTVVHLMPWLMERQLDRTAAELLQQSLEAKGLAFRLEAKTEALVADESGRVCGVRLAGGEGTEEIVLSDPGNGVYKKLVLKDDRLVGSVLYGDTVDGAWYFKLLRDRKNVAEIRDRLMFGEANLGDTGHQGQSRALAMADSAEVCGCNGVCKGTIVRAIKDKGLFTLDEVRKHTKASSSCGSCTGLVEQLLMATAGSDYSTTPKLKPICACTDRTHQETRDAIRKHHLLSI